MAQTPAGTYLNCRHVIAFGIENGDYMPTGRLFDTMCDCIAELEHEVSYQTYLWR